MMMAIWRARSEQLSTRNKEIANDMGKTMIVRGIDTDRTTL